MPRTYHMKQLREVFLGVALFVLGLATVQFVLIMLMLLNGGGRLWDLAFRIFPSACPAELGTCVGQAVSAWSFFIWSGVALGYGFIAHRWSLPAKLWGGIGVVILVAIAINLAVPLFGYQVVVDTL